MEADRKPLLLPLIMPSHSPDLAVFFLQSRRYSDRSFFWLARIAPTTLGLIIFVRCFSFRSRPSVGLVGPSPSPSPFHTDSSLVLLLPALSGRPAKHHRSTTSAHTELLRPLLILILLLFRPYYSSPPCRDDDSEYLDRSFVEPVPQSLLLTFQRPGPGDRTYAGIVGEESGHKARDRPRTGLRSAIRDDRQNVDDGP